MHELSRRQITLIVAAVLAVAALVVSAYGIITGPRSSQAAASAGSSPDSSGVHTQQVSSRSMVLDRDPDTRQLPRTDDAVVYARAVAAALFDWSTSAGYVPADYQAPVLSDSDPSGEETPGLITDVGTYLPTLDQWLDLATMDVTQTLTIDSAAVPDGWQSIVDHAHGELRPGTVAVTIAGTRQRTGIWDHEHAATSSPVAFTVFVACRPAFERCHVLRLSILNDPLR